MNKIEFLYNKDKYQGIDSSKALSHYGILGQKWGQRRWQNADGTFNEAGKERYFGPSGTTKKNKLDDQKIGSIFNKKNVSYNDPKYNPYIDEENKIWDNVKEQQSKNWAKDKELINDLAGKELKYYDEDPILLEYYSNIKADIANKMKEKYPSIEPRTFRMNVLHAENEPFVSGYDGQEELREQYKELHEKTKKYPPRSAKRVKLEGEAALINAKEELNQKKIEEELNENVEKYIKENKNNILQDINRIREKIKDINIVDDHGDYYVTRALEEHNKKKYNNFNEKGLKDLSDDEWNDIKNIAKAKYEDDISMQNKLFNDQKIGSTNSKEDAKANKEAVNPKTSAKDVKINWDIDESMKPYQNAINEEAQRILTDIITRNPGGAIPSSMSVKVGPDAKFTAEFSYDEEPKIGNIYDFGFKVQRNSRGGIIDKQGRKAFADAIKRNRDMVDAQNLTDDEVDEIVNNRIKATSNEDLLAQFNVQSLRYQMEKALNMKFGGNSKEDAKANKEAVKLLADLNDKDYTKRSETLQKLYDDPRFEEQRNNVDKAIKEKFKDDFDELEKTYGGFDEVENEYLALAGLNSALMVDGKKMEDISYMPRLYLYDDLNQGELTGEAIWAYDNGITDSWDRWEKLNRKEREAKDDLINSLSSDGSYNSKVLSKLDDRTKKDIIDHIYNYKSIPNSYWTLYNAGDTSKSEYDSVKDTTLKEAKEISKKLSSSCGNDASGWALLNKAVNNLNLGGKDYTELTQADWDRINAEINSLKR